MTPAGVAELADARDSKSRIGNDVWVRPPPPAPKILDTSREPMTFGKTIPIFRIFDEAKAREFYVGFLGFTVDWEHRITLDLPLYMQVSKGECVLHLSEHHGDGSPGAAIRIETADIDAFHAALPKDYKYARPGINEPPWGGREVSVHDPFGNRLTFTSTS
jgi:catechol 2,3-dioxygenase-like lactoylglutathione lyase family enzyme